ncbi:hypothetical protein ASC93_20320 [Massilia sp. Root335]|nr:hypothetical protein ASC93_20320 [Massilia sp. Root335]
MPSEPAARKFNATIRPSRKSPTNWFDPRVRSIASGQMPRMAPRTRAPTSIQKNASPAASVSPKIHSAVLRSRTVIFRCRYTPSSHTGISSRIFGPAITAAHSSSSRLG